MSEEKDGFAVVRVPFMGFYETIHSANVGDLLLDLYGCANPEHDTKEWKEKESCYDETCASNATDEQFKEVQRDYCREYVDKFSKAVGVPLEYCDLHSPREYNFQTDAITAYMPIEWVEKLKELVDPTLIREMVRSRFTSCPGFCSFYDSNYDNWGKKVTHHEYENGVPVDTTVEDEPFDEIQLGTLLECYMIQQQETEDEKMLWEHWL